MLPRRSGKLRQVTVTDTAAPSVLRVLLKMLSAGFIPSVTGLLLNRKSLFCRCLLRRQSRRACPAEHRLRGIRDQSPEVDAAANVTLSVRHRS